MQTPSSQCCLPHLECLDLSDQSDLDNIKEVVNNGTPVALKPTVWGRGRELR